MQITLQETDYKVLYIGQVLSLGKLCSTKWLIRLVLISIMGFDLVSSILPSLLLQWGIEQKIMMYNSHLDMNRAPNIFGLQ